MESGGWAILLENMNLLIGTIIIHKVTNKSEKT